MAKAAPEGYTLLAGNPGPLTVAPAISLYVPYDTQRDFTPVTLVAKSPSVLIVHPSVPAKNVREFVALAESRPGKLNYASASPGTVGQMAAELFKSMVGVNIVEVPYKGATQALTSLLANEVQLMFVTLSSSITFVKQGRLRALGIVAPKRVAAIPDVPTMAESGFPSMTVGSWQGLFAPKGVPADVVKKLYAVMMKVMDDANVRKRLAEGGVDLFMLETFRDANELAAAVRAVRAVSPLPIVAQMTVEDDGNSLDGTPPERFAPELEKRGATVRMDSFTMASQRRGTPVASRS